MKIAVDVMGGDKHPEEIIAGVCRYISRFKREVIVIGDEHIITKKLLLHPLEKKYIEIVHTDEVIFMDENPVEAYKKKKNASVVLAARLVSEKKATGFFTPGNTGGALTASLFEIGKIEGVHRPALATIIPTQTKYGIMIDAGANADCKPTYLLQFAYMASIFCKHILQIKNPIIGLLSNGSEDTKGSQVAYQAYELLKKSDLNFYGNIEGYNLFDDTVDIIVTDGFSGNIALKTAEGTAKVFLKLLKDKIQNSIFYSIGASLMKPAIYSVKKKMDAREYGGAPLLGIKGNVLIGHGNSDDRATFNALKVLEQMESYHMQEEISEVLKQTKNSDNS